MAENLKTGGAKCSGSISNVLPGRRLATSKIPRMLTPSEIELLQQDLKAALKLLGQDEIEDAQTLMREQGFRSDDFEILQRADPSPPFPSAVTGTVVVLRRSSKVSRSYAAGHDSAWLGQLEADLKLGAFGGQK
jgi:hypothetical protein